MLKGLFENLKKKEKLRFEKVLTNITQLSDEELKQWYHLSEADSMMGRSNPQDDILNSRIELELNNRGFVFMEDY